MCIYKYLHTILVYTLQFMYDSLYFEALSLVI